MHMHDVAQLFTTPLDAPAFAPTRYRFTDREYLNITYRTDPEALRRVVPEPLSVPEPLVRFEIMRMPDVTGLGDYTEAGQVIPVEHEGERGEYNLAMYLDSVPAISSGRELSAYPKKAGSPRLYVDSDTLVGTLDYGSLRVATATMGYKHHPMDLEEARAEICVPTFMVKAVPGYDGRPRICELVRTQITDITVKSAFRGPARLELFAHALAPLADLPVLEVVAAGHILTDLTLSPAAVVHDYLAH
ncbi:acetoacetate decarboxylase [Streptomyces eurocidicus]|uniref:Acetoacetate decarboxylase n=1 Tax=Streptomyces eurocidicus TaxID=66423 RepID=A0A2N8NUF2_STREU|nr:acetoacetate decarboxylase [Streptomyces eurocidicus]MBB5120234.1 acetoacetate decarboxylase [Streptomyces eurocidicus]MBF6056083.1 acetoacetate decarboxylase [Streptomyces eurocidicus]PNE32382.1 acetoacetate decarboxylase [Streptomyces eurocidicus]